MVCKREKLHPVILMRKAYDLRFTVHVQFLIHVGNMFPDGQNADIKQYGNAFGIKPVDGM